MLETVWRDPDKTRSQRPKHWLLKVQGVGSLVHSADYTAEAGSSTSALPSTLAMCSGAKCSKAADACLVSLLHGFSVEEWRLTSMAGTDDVPSSFPVFRGL